MNYIVCHGYEDWIKHPDMLLVPVKRVDGGKIPHCEALSVGDKIVYFTIGDRDVVTYNEVEEKAEQEKYGIRGIYEIKETDLTEFPYDWSEHNNRLFRIEPVLIAQKRVMCGDRLNQGTVHALTQEQFDKIEDDINEANSSCLQPC